MRVLACFRWSLKRGEARQVELVGMTAVAEAGVVDPLTLLTVVKDPTFETLGAGIYLKAPVGT